ncbi:translational GTPase TypA [bacterium]|nr:translational GTPase TypA [bacterium]
MSREQIRNIAIIAHVDHGKTTLVDQLFKQSGLFRDNQVVSERMMDSMDLERERGITITSKNGAFYYEGVRINIIDTPGHADFGGQVERVLKMADGVLLLVDAQEGPMPQTYFVLKKALSLSLPVIVVMNKIDKPAARVEWVHDQILELFIRLNAPDEFLDFPMIYASARDGYASENPDDRSGTMEPLYKKIIEFMPGAKGDSDAPFQLLISSLSYSTFLGRLGVGKIAHGSITMNQPAVIVRGDEAPISFRITKLYRFEGNEMVEVSEAHMGDIVAVAGIDSITVGDTVADPSKPEALPSVDIDPPTISMNFVPNDSPFSGTEGKFVTSRHIKDRLDRELLSDVALHVSELNDQPGFKVSGRGELHLSILIEKMRREGYEFAVTRPKVIFKEENGQRLEPYEELTIDVDENYMGKVIENLGGRKGQMLEMTPADGLVRLRYTIPTRGLLGFKSEFMTDTKGMGTMNYVFLEFGPYCGEIRNRKNGVLVSKEPCTTNAYAINNLQERAVLFLGPGEKVYEGQIVGENAREDDMIVNPSKGKKLTNVRASGSDDAIMLIPPRVMSLEQCISYINDDELVEVTPKSIRLRKLYLNENDRKRFSK